MFFWFFFLSIAFNIFAGNQQEEKLSNDVQISLHSSIINPITPHLVFPNQLAADNWLLKMSKKLLLWIPDEFMRKRILTVIQYESVRAGLDTQMVLSLITVESRFDRYAISSAGEIGIMQVMPFWVQTIGNNHQSLLNLNTNIRYGCTILRYYLQLENGDWYYALGRYNGSRGQSKYPSLVFAAYSKYWSL